MTLSVAARIIRRIRAQVLVIFRASGASFARPVAPPPKVSVCGSTNHGFIITEDVQDDTSAGGSPNPAVHLAKLQAALARKFAEALGAAGDDVRKRSL